MKSDPKSIHAYIPSKAKPKENVANLSLEKWLSPIKKNPRDLIPSPLVCLQLKVQKNISPFAPRTRNMLSDVTVSEKKIRDNLPVLLFLNQRVHVRYIQYC